MDISAGATNLSWAEVVLGKNYFGCFINRIPSRLLGLHEKVGEKPLI